jgi:hypothetical protein
MATRTTMGIEVCGNREKGRGAPGVNVGCPPAGCPVAAQYWSAANLQPHLSEDTRP